VRHAPSHAGKLPAWERLVFATIFALMTAFVVGVTMSAVNGGNPATTSSSGSSDNSATSRLQTVTGGGQHSQQSPAGGRADSRSLDRRLAAALRPLVTSDAGQFAVGVIDVSTGARAVFDADRSFRTAGLAKIDILAALLLEHQQAGTQVTAQQAAMVSPMIENSSGGAEADLYQAAGAAAGMRSANARLGLTHTVMGPAGQSDLTRTTVADQLSLLTDLAASRSVLSPASQDYALELMGNVQPSQRWGVSAEANPGTRYAIADGWLADPVLWVTNSMGVIEHNGQHLLIVVLADGQPTEAAGITLVGLAAADATRVVTHP
jgi:hypothetical protein